MLQLHNIQGCW